MSQPRHFRIFLSSPGDVPQERDDAQMAVQELNDTDEFSDLFTLKLMRWDDPEVVIPMPVSDTPQESVNIYMIRPSECDLVVVLFWARMGSPLVMDEREYLSGTHYEYSEGLDGYQKQGIPSVWLYRCAEEAFVSQRDPQRNEKNQQFDRVEQFFKQFRDPDGRLTSGVNEYAKHTDFKQLFRGQLTTYLRHLREKLQSTAQQPIMPSNHVFNGVPYRGLNALTEDDAKIFFGRDTEVLELLNRVDNQRLVAVLGASGSGKSSLVAAGVVPKLRERGWEIISCTPTANPFYSLALAMTTSLDEFAMKPTDRFTQARNLAITLSKRPENLVQQIELAFPLKRILIFIDQFEEIFTLAEKNPSLKSNGYDEITIFLQALQYSSRQITVLFTLRADFYGLALPHLKVLEQDVYGLRPASIFALIEMITRPAELAGLTLDSEVAQRIISEVGGEAGALALIAYLMEALYRRMRERYDTHMTIYDYEMLGGVREAIDTLANQAYTELPFDQDTKSKALQNVFRNLIAITEEDGQFIPTRRPAALEKFELESSERQLISAFTNARLLVVDNNLVVVAHEAILRYWKRLAIWISIVKDDLALISQFERDSQLWATRNRQSPLPSHEALIYLYRALRRLNIRWDDLAEPLRTYTEPEARRLLREVNNSHTSHKRRYDIGDRLSVIRDPRRGLGIDVNDTPQIEWCSVTPGGEVTIDASTVIVQPFFIAKYLITYIQFQAFVKASDGFAREEWWLGMPKEFKYQEVSSPPSQQPNYPRSTVSWYQSIAFSRWLNYRLKGTALSMPKTRRHLTIGRNAEVRLPVEQEWQWAAQGGKLFNKYPWGNWENDPPANTTEAGINDRSTAVGMYPTGVALCGALDMAGNLSEWCTEEYQISKKRRSRTNANNSTEYRILRGGSFLDPLKNAMCTHRSRDIPSAISFDYGIRVVVAPIL